MSKASKMDPALKAKWVEALRSGKYKQCRGQLHNEAVDAYCCLGVLQAIAPAIEQHPAGELLNARWLLMSEQQRLVEMNDKGSSFDYIADYIEANL